MDIVKGVYNNLLNKRDLTGRLGEVFLPILAVAKLIDEEKLYQEIKRFAALCEGERALQMKSPMKAMMVQVLCENIDFRGRIKGTDIVDAYNWLLAREKYLSLNAGGDPIPMLAPKVYPILRSLNFITEKGAANATYVDVDIEVLEDLAEAYGFEKLLKKSEKFRKDRDKKLEKQRKKLRAEGHTEAEIRESEALEAIGDKKMKE